MGTMLDSSALLAHLRREAGHEIVTRYLLDWPRMCTVNLSEVAAILMRSGLPPGDAAGALGELPIETVVFDKEMALQAGVLIVYTKRLGLSLGDRACLAAALRFGDAVVTADRAWRELGPVLGMSVELIRHTAP